MKNLLALSALLLTTASAASLPDLLNPSTDAINAACAAGYRIEGMPRTNLEQTKAYNLAIGAEGVGRRLTDSRSMGGNTLRALARPIIIQTPAGGAFNVCAARAKRLEDQSVVSAPMSLLVYVHGVTTRPASAESWNAVLVFLEADGKELGRVQPSELTRRGKAEDWKVSCTSGGCNYVGSNTYYFTPGSFPADYQKVRLLFTRGDGTEQREYSSAEFEKTLLSDSR